MRQLKTLSKRAKEVRLRRDELRLKIKYIIRKKKAKKPTAFAENGQRLVMFFL